MNAADFWREIKAIADDTVARYAPFRAKASNVNTNGVQIQTYDSDTPMGERFAKLRGPVVNIDDEVAVIPYGGSNLILGAIDNEPVPPPSKESIGLGNVDNTSDSAKPVSSAQATAIANSYPTVRNNGTNVNTNAVIIQAINGMQFIQHGTVPNTVNMQPTYGTVANTVAAGNHSHTVTSAFPMTHRTGFASMNLRMGPNTTFTVIASVPINTQMHRTGWTQAAGGYTWHYVLCNGWGWGWFAGTVGSDIVPL